MVKWAFLTVLFTFIALGSIVYYRTGAYKDVSVEKVDRSSLNTVYKKHMGPYHKIVEVIREVEDWARLNDIDCKQTFGEYLDDPKSVEEDRLRSHGGCITNSNIVKLPQDFYQAEIPAGHYIWAHFEGSPSIGPFKVYPKVFEWAQEQRVKLGKTNFEIYTINGESMVTEYLFPIADGTQTMNKKVN